MTTWVHRNLLVTPAYTTLARSLAAGLDPVAGGGMFTTPVYDTTTGALRYYISSGFISDTFAAVLADPALLHAACVEAGAPVTLPMYQAMLAACIVGDGTRNVLVEGVDPDRGAL